MTHWSQRKVWDRKKPPMEVTSTGEGDNATYWVVVKGTEERLSPVFHDESEAKDWIQWNK